MLRSMPPSSRDRNNVPRVVFSDEDRVRSVKIVISPTARRRANSKVSKMNRGVGRIGRLTSDLNCSSEICGYAMTEPTHMAVAKITMIFILLVSLPLSFLSPSFLFLCVSAKREERSLDGRKRKARRPFNSFEFIRLQIIDRIGKGAETVGKDSRRDTARR